MTEAKTHPERYKVERIGHPDPAATRYAVLDPVHDFAARPAMVVWANGLRAVGKHEAADAVMAFLDSTKQAHADACAKKNELDKKLQSRKGTSTKHMS